MGKNKNKMLHKQFISQTRDDEPAAILRTLQGEAVALQGVCVNAVLRDLMAEVEVEQSYANPKSSNIEAVYTFPLPLGAVLLGFEVEIADRKLAGQVVERKQAERQYEDAITDGNSAIMLEEAGPGLYTVNIGNLMAHEKAVIRYRYGLLLSWQGDRLRFLLPTTIAPRYGDPLKAGMQPHQVPQSSLLVEYPLELNIRVEGALAGAEIGSPSHAITMLSNEQGLSVKLVGQAVLDRDFVLTLRFAESPSLAVLAPDGDAQVALASLRLPTEQESSADSLCLKIVIDCSGSMGGVSIAQARNAAMEILNHLQPEDRFNIILFGSNHIKLFPLAQPASEANLARAASQIEGIDADLGGTEMAQALSAAYAEKSEEKHPVVLLITDGEIHDHEAVIQQAITSRHRVFTVGVGNAVAQAFVQGIATRTGGACELVAPQEGMSERVLTQFHRLRQARVRHLALEFPVKPLWRTPLPECVFAGDTVHVFAGFQEKPQGEIRLSARDSKGRVLQCQTSLSIIEDAALPRMAAAHRMSTANDEEKLQLALRYQLLSELTNYLVIAERAEKAADLPEVHQVPQMLAAGWGGTGKDLSGGIMLANVVSSLPDVVKCCRRSVQAPSLSHLPGGNSYAIPSFLRRAVDTDQTTGLPDASPMPCAPPPPQTADEFVEALNRLLAAGQLPSTINDLRRCGLAVALADELLRLVVTGNIEVKVVIAFLQALSVSDCGEGLYRGSRRIILKFWKEQKPSQELNVQMSALLGGISKEQLSEMVTAPV